LPSADTNAAAAAAVLLLLLLLLLLMMEEKVHETKNVSHPTNQGTTIFFECKKTETFL